jgi:hypothetical protein
MSTGEPGKDFFGMTARFRTGLTNSADFADKRFIDFREG